MNKEWEVKDLGPISRCLGMRFTEDSQHVCVDKAPLSESTPLIIDDEEVQSAQYSYGRCSTSKRGG